MNEYQKVLVTGVKGQLGYDVVKRLNELGINCVGVDVEDFDLTDYEQVSSKVRLLQPTAIIHCAAYTAVDAAESNEQLCNLVNVKGTENIAQVAEYLKAKLIYISTDYVFSGEGESAFETDSPKVPCNVYGRSKYLGEQAAQKYCSRTFIVRTSWVYGLNGGNFVKTMLRLAAEHSSINVVNDQIGSPTYTRDLAVLLCDMVQTEKYGVYHATNEGYCSWAQFAAEIMSLAGKQTYVNPILSSEYKTAARRPLNSRLSKISLDFAGFKRLPHWKDALKRYIEELNSSVR